MKLIFFLILLPLNVFSEILSVSSSSNPPVILSLFRADFNSNTKDIYLYWLVDSQVNNVGFYIERSNDQINFQEVGFVEGTGTTTLQQEYFFTDTNIQMGKIYYYRIKQIDFDGTIEIFPIISVVTPPENKELEWWLFFDLLGRRIR